MRGTQGAPWGGKSGESTSQGTAQVVGGITVAAGKPGTAQLQNLLDVGCRHATCQQSACDPQVYNAPIRPWEALRNAPALHPGLIDRGRLRGALARWNKPWSQRREGRPALRWVAAPLRRTHAESLS